jgi:hypothetical protein
MTRRGRRALSNAVDEIVQDAEDEIAEDEIQCTNLDISFTDPDAVDETRDGGLVIDFDTVDT